MWVNGTLVLRRIGRWIARERIGARIFRHYCYWDEDPALGSEEIRETARAVEDAEFHRAFGQASAAEHQ